ncbi:KGK domain-containing protein [Anabaena azotica]|uniref:KGK domain-containing protein n=1 Tax=Anabaena azotica TaxID=197653 RepID=UPI001A7E41AC|nr:KGK domain-containing protein [Anabaena azotica]
MKYTKGLRFLAIACLLIMGILSNGEFTSIAMEKIVLQDKDVISIEKDKSLIGASTFKANEIYIYLRDKIARDVGIEAADEWVFEGLPCELLTAEGQGWQSGKVWFCLEFIPDEKENSNETDDEPTKALPESPLDDLRAELLDS